MVCGLWTLDIGLWTFLKDNFAMGNHNRRSANANLIDRAEFVFDFNIYPAGTLHKITLFNNKSMACVAGLDISRAVMYQVSSQRPRSAARSRVFRNIISRSKQACMRACFTDLDGFTTEGVAPSGAGTLVDFGEQRSIDSAST